jgi:hypothetical protein
MQETADYKKSERTSENAAAIEAKAAGSSE